MRKTWQRFRALTWWKRWLGYAGAVFCAFLLLGAILDLTGYEPDEPTEVAEVEEGVARESEPETDMDQVESEPDPAPEPVKEPEPEPEPEAESEPEPEPTPAERRAEKKAELEAEISDALEDVDAPIDDPEIRNVSVLTPRTLDVEVETPEGGLDGPSTTDLNYMASAVFADVYGETDYRGSTLIYFKGGLIDTRTGQDKPDSITARYEVTGSDAKQIDWGDEDAIEYGINWSLYREFTHPAIKMDD